jgi:hypothetical protein
MADLVEGLDLGRTGGPVGHHQRPDRLHVPVPGLGRPTSAVRHRCLGASSLDSIQRAGLSGPPAGLPVGAVHLDHLHPPPSAGTGPGQRRRSRCPPPRPGPLARTQTARTARQPGRPDSQDGLLATERLLRPYFGMHRFNWPDDDAVEFHLGRPRRHDPAAAPLAPGGGGSHRVPAPTRRHHTPSARHARMGAEWPTEKSGRRANDTEIGSVPAQLRRRCHLNAN